MDRLNQLRARSRHEIEAHEGGLDNTDTGRYFIGEASELLAALRLWAQIQYRTDQVVREILKFGDVVALNDIARQLQELGTPRGTDRRLVGRRDREQVLGRADGHRWVRATRVVTLRAVGGG